MNVIKRLFIVILTIVYFCITICGGFFLMEAVNAWNCPRCGYDYCDKCFIENNGKII